MPNVGTEQRKLAAIMFTDMVGYSATVQKNESLALKLLEEHRRLLRPFFPQFGGQEVKTMGDAFLVEFASALEAVRCAMEMQKKLVEYNASSPETVKILIRIGIHVGDVVHRENDIFGDGVNIAARIEPLAEPGGICLSEDVARQVHQKLDTPITKLGRGELKNIQLPVQVYRVEMPWQAQRSASLSRLKFRLRQKATQRWTAGVLIILASLILFWWPRKQATREAAQEPGDLPKPPTAIVLDPHRLAILPLTSINPDQKSQVFAAGMTEELNTKLRDIRGLIVIVQQSANQFATNDLATIGRMLEVGTILTGSVQLEGNQLRIHLRLIDVRSKQQKWAEPFDREYKDIFAIQTAVAESVAKALNIQLLASDRLVLEQKPTENLSAYGYYLDGRVHLNDGTREGTDKAIELFRQATVLDTNFAIAFTGLARAYIWKEKFYEPGKGWDKSALAAVDKALLVNSDLPEAIAAGADVFYTPARNWDATNAVKEYRKALRLKENLPTAHEGLAFIFSHCGLLNKAVDEAQKVLLVDPQNNITRGYFGQALMYQQKYPEAYSVLQKQTESFVPWSRGFGLGLCLIHLHRTDESAALLEQYLEQAPDHPLLTCLQAVLYAAAGETNKAEEKIQITLQGESRMTHFHHASYYVGAAHALMKQNKRAVEFLKKAFEDGFPCYPHFQNDPLLSNLRGDPDFIAFMAEKKPIWEKLRDELRK